VINKAAHCRKGNAPPYFAFAVKIAAPILQEMSFIVNGTSHTIMVNKGAVHR